MTVQLVIDNIAQVLQEELPGKTSQYTMAPAVGKKYEEVRSDHRLACVMVLLYPEEDSLKVAYIRRATHNPRDKHAGQISFPGGKYEEEDVDFVTCALRETEEEIGVPARDVSVLGRLSELYVYASNFVVHPFIGFVNQKPEFVLQASEVAGLLNPPLHYLADTRIIKKDSIRVRNMVINDVPYFDLYGEKLWGATAMITSEMLELYRRSLHMEKWV